MKVINISDESHPYFHRETKDWYTWGPGQTLDVPNDIAEFVMSCHPHKFMAADDSDQPDAPADLGDQPADGDEPADGTTDPDGSSGDPEAATDPPATDPPDAGETGDPPGAAGEQPAADQPDESGDPEDSGDKPAGGDAPEQADPPATEQPAPKRNTRRQATQEA